MISGARVQFGGARSRDPRARRGLRGRPRRAVLRPRLRVRVLPARRADPPRRHLARHRRGRSAPPAAVVAVVAVHVVGQRRLGQFTSGPGAVPDGHHGEHSDGGVDHHGARRRRTAVRPAPRLDLPGRAGDDGVVARVRQRRPPQRAPLRSAECVRDGPHRAGCVLPRRRPGRDLDRRRADVHRCHLDRGDRRMDHPHRALRRAARADHHHRPRRGDRCPRQLCPDLARPQGGRARGDGGNAGGRWNPRRTVVVVVLRSGAAGARASSRTLHRDRTRPLRPRRVHVRPLPTRRRHRAHGAWRSRR